MRYFHRIAEGVDVGQLMHAVARQPELWDQNTLRTTHAGSAHAQAQDIWLRFKRTGGDAKAIVDDLDVIPYPAWRTLPQAKTLIMGLMSRVEGVRLGSVVITKREAGKKITPHEDSGAYADYYDRYHIVLQSLPGSLFTCGDETVNMKTGEVWWFDRRVTHHLANNSPDDVVTMIADIRVEP